MAALSRVLREAGFATALVGEGRLAEAVAVLGDDVPLPRAATLNRLDLAAAERTADMLAATTCCGRARRLPSCIR
jgi:hypothetical protein